MMYDEQVGAPVGGLLGHLVGGVDREQHLLHRCPGVPVDQADGVPALGGGGREPPVQQLDHFCQRRHGVRLAGARSQMRVLSSASHHSPTRATHPVSMGNSFKAILALCIAMPMRSEEHTSELQSLMSTSYAVFCLQKKKTKRQKECT